MFHPLCLYAALHLAFPCHNFVLYQIKMADGSMNLSILLFQHESQQDQREAEAGLLKGTWTGENV